MNLNEHQPSTPDTAAAPPGSSAIPTASEEVWLTLYPAGEKAKGRRGRTTWKAFFEKLASTTTAKTTEKLKLPGWSAATFKGDRRRTSGTEWLYAVVLDFDHGATTMAMAAALWVGAYVFGYSSWSHTPENPRFRLVIVLARPVTAAEYAVLWAYVADKVRAAGQEIDEACKDSARLWFLYAPRTEHHTTLLQEGAPLDVDAVLQSQGQVQRVLGLRLRDPTRTS